MAVNIKSQDVERLLNDVVQMTGESKTEAIRKALEERRQRLQMRSVVRHDEARLLAFLREEVWAQIPLEEKGVRLQKEEEEALLGYGETGV